MEFSQMYKGLVHDAVLGRRSTTTGNLDCLLHPSRYAPVWQTAPCDCGEAASCIRHCLFGAITRDSAGAVTIDKAKCVGCEACVGGCQTGRLTESRDILPVLELLKTARGSVFALMAPAFVGQYLGVTPGQLRRALKALGFTGMVEVALFADILTLKEALTFNRLMGSGADFMLTSCCCPIWIALVRREGRRFLKNIPDSVSPMVACGRAVKQLAPGARTVFIGPCLAKKVEAREPDVADAVDFVLTFRELQDMFEAFHIAPDLMPEDVKEHASGAGRLYGRSGGVSWAVAQTALRLNPGSSVKLRAQVADGAASCRALLTQLGAGEISANFLEGMGCAGGCVGGPAALVDRAAGKERLEMYSGEAAVQTPLDNPNVLALLWQLGLPTPESLLGETLFTRHLAAPAFVGAE